MKCEVTKMKKGTGGGHRQYIHTGIVSYHISVSDNFETSRQLRKILGYIKGLLAPTKSSTMASVQPFPDRPTFYIQN